MQLHGLAIKFALPPGLGRWSGNRQSLVAHHEGCGDAKAEDDSLHSFVVAEGELQKAGHGKACHQG